MDGTCPPYITCGLKRIASITAQLNASLPSSTDGTDGWNPFSASVSPSHFPSTQETIYTHVCDSQNRTGALLADNGVKVPPCIKLEWMGDLFRGLFGGHFSSLHFICSLPSHFLSLSLVYWGWGRDRCARLLWRTVQIHLLWANNVGRNGFRFEGKYLFPFLKFSLVYFVHSLTSLWKTGRKRWIGSVSSIVSDITEGWAKGLNRDWVLHSIRNYWGWVKG